MPKYRVVKGRVFATKGAVVEMSDKAASRFGNRLEKVKPGPKKQADPQLHVQPEKPEVSGDGTQGD